MIQNIFFALVFGLLFYIIGFFLTSFWQYEKTSNQFKMFFLRTTLGMLSSTTIFALLKSNGNTILSGVFILFFLFLFFNRNSLTKKPSFKLSTIDTKAIAVFLLILITINIFLTFLVFPNSYGVHPDFLFYSAIGDYLNIYGKETYFLSIYPEYVKTNLYHYANEWCIGLISNFTNLTGTESLLYVFFPISFSVLFIGLMYLTQRVLNTGLVKSFFFSLIFFITSSLSLGESLPSLFEIGSFNIYYASFFSTPSSGKMIIVTILLLMVLVFYDRTKEHNSVFLLCIVPFIWPTTIFGIAGGISIYIIYKAFYKEYDIGVIFVLLIMMVLWFTVFYLFQPSVLQPSVLQPSVEASVNTYSASYYDRFMKYYGNNFNFNDLFRTIFETIASRIYYYSILIFIIALNFKTIKQYFSNKHKFKRLAMLFLFIALSALVSRFILFHLPDSNQIFTNIIDNTLAKLFFFTIILISLKKRINYLFVVLFLFLSASTHYYQFHRTKKETIESEIATTLQKEFKNNKNARFAYLISSFENMTTFYGNFVKPPLYQLRSFSSSYFPVNLSIYDQEHYFEKDVASKNRPNLWMKNSAFYHYVTKNNIKEVNWDTKLQFLLDEKIDYLIIENGAIHNSQLEQLDIEKTLPSFREPYIIYKLRHN